VEYPDTVAQAWLGSIHGKLGDIGGSVAVTNLPTDYPDATTHGLLGSIHDRLHDIKGSMEVTNLPTDYLRESGSVNILNFPSEYPDSTTHSWLGSIHGKIQTQSPDLLVKDLSVGTDAVQVDADAKYRDEVIILADEGNTDVVYVGNSTSQLFPLAAGASVAIRKTALNLIYVKAASGTQTVHVIAGGA